MEIEFGDDDHGNYPSKNGTIVIVDIRPSPSEFLYRIRLISCLRHRVRLRIVRFQCNLVSVRLEARVTKDYDTWLGMLPRNPNVKLPLQVFVW